jgi:hypothetical protein
LVASDRQRHAVKIALLAAAYYASAKLGLKLAFETGSVTAVWPPTGIALAALRDRPGLAAAAPPALLDLSDAQPDEEGDHRDEVGDPGQPVAGVGVVHLAAV